MTLKAAVIGVGSMGRNHARVYNDIEGVELVAVADIDVTTAIEVASRYKVSVSTDYREMLEKVKPNIVSVAVPAHLHYQVAADVIGCESVVGLLIEKPITTNVADARSIIGQAHDTGVILSVGHIMRFNPAIIELKKMLDQRKLGYVFLIHARRLGPYPSRITDVGTTLDIATHDTDIMCYLADDSVKRVYAETTQWVNTQHEDSISGTIYFSNGIVGTLEASWLTPMKVRELTVVGQKGMFLVNYLTQDLFFYENDYTDDAWENLRVMRGVSEGRMTRLKIKREEPLKLELESFAKAVATGKQPLVSGEDGLRALSLATQLLTSSQSHTVVRVGEIRRLATLRKGPTVSRGIDRRER